MYMCVCIYVCVCVCVFKLLNHSSDSKESTALSEPRHLSRLWSPQGSALHCLRPGNRWSPDTPTPPHPNKWGSFLGWWAILDCVYCGLRRLPDLSTNWQKGGSLWYCGQLMQKDNFENYKQPYWVPQHWPSQMLPSPSNCMWMKKQRWPKEFWLRLWGLGKGQ